MAFQADENERQMYWARIASRLKAKAFNIMCFAELTVELHVEVREDCRGTEKSSTRTRNYKTAMANAKPRRAYGSSCLECFSDSEYWIIGLRTRAFLVEAEDLSEDAQTTNNANINYERVVRLGYEFKKKLDPLTTKRIYVVIFCIITVFKFGLDFSNEAGL